MKRTRRHKFLQISIFVLLWSIIKVLSDSTETDTATDKKETKPEEAKTSKTDHDNILVHGYKLYKDTHDKHLKFASKPKENANEETISSVTNKGTSPQETPQETAKEEGKTKEEEKTETKEKEESKEKPGVNEKQEAKEKQETKEKLEPKEKQEAKEKVITPAPKSHSKNTKKPTEGAQTGPEKTNQEKGVHPVIPPKLPKNENETSVTANKTTEDMECIPPAIQQFPKPLMGPKARKRGGIILHVIVAMYTFLGLAIVCDEYFVASLDRICEEMKMSPDVAGATFMAAGSSAPELATVVIGVFFAKDDIGISGVIGSAVFNIMFVISVCALCSGTVAYLNWWPLVRDSFFYAVAILVMLITISNKKITWYESLFMLFMYLVYCVVLHFNTRLEKWAQTWDVPFKKYIPSEQSGLVTYKTLEEDGKYNSYGVTSPDMMQENAEQGFGNQLSGPALNEASGVAPPPAPQPIQQDYYRPKEYNPENSVNPLIKPACATTFQLISWVVVFPIHYMCLKTMPDVRTERFRNWYPFTFFISMVWISFYSYFMVWMITIIGTTMGIPDTVMGLTFVAAGVSVPDALSSIAVIKEGYGDMAVSNAIGSNVFDILVCLGLPWFIKTAIIKPGSEVGVYSKGLTYSTLSLLSTVVFLVVAVHYNGWKLDQKFGAILMVWYLIFITFASMYELNVFGYLNPRECGSDY